MQITATDNWNGKPVTTTVAGMVEYAMEHRADRDGSLETALERGRVAAEVVARIVGRLVEKDLLTLADLDDMGLVPYRYEDVKLVKI